MSELASREPKDTNGGIALVFAASSLLLIGPIGAVLAVIFAARSRQALGYRSTASRVALVVGWIVIGISVAVIAALFLLIFLIDHSNLTY